MHQSVIDAWFKHSAEYEGRVSTMYLDILGLVTTAQGNLVDTISEAQKLNWKLPNGVTATDAQVAEEWRLLKGQQSLAKFHYKIQAQRAPLRLHLDDRDIDALVIAKLLANEAYMRKSHFPEWDSWPADAQLAVSSMAWAVGPGFAKKFPNFTRMINAGQWRQILKKDANGGWAGKIRETAPDGTFNAGVVPRNKSNYLCLENTVYALEHELPLGELFWPGRAEVYVGNLEPQKAPSPVAEPTRASDATLRAQVLALQADYARQIRDADHLDKMAELAGIESQPPPKLES
jgi:GH24 family phage-related lysozyme (muramidase)